MRNAAACLALAFSLSLTGPELASSSAKNAGSGASTGAPHTLSSPSARTVPPTVRATASAWSRALNTWYGPGFYGNRTACGQTLTTKTRGVAHRTLPCGTKLSFRKGSRLVRVRVIDRGPYSAALFDLTARTAQDLCACRRPYTTTHHYKRGWN